MKKTILQKNICIVEVDLDGFDRDGIGKLEDLLRLELINEEYWNPKAVVYGGKRAGNINQKKKLDVLETCMYPLCGKCYRWEYFFNKHPKYGESVKYQVSITFLMSL